MKILLGADTYAPDVNGSAHFSQRLATGLAERGHQVHVVCPSDSSISWTETTAIGAGRLTVHRISSRRWPWHDTFRVCFPWQVLPQTKALLAQIQPDVVHLQAHIMVGRGLARAAQSAGIGLVATNHVMPENLIGYVPLPRPLLDVISSWIWRDLGRVYGRADLVTAPTPRAIALLEQHTTLRGGEAISCGIDSARYFEASRQAEANPVPTVLFVGRLDPEKHIDELLRACAGLPKDLGVRLEIIGEGDRHLPLVGLAEQLGIADRVIFHGQVSDEELLKAYGRADIFCMPGTAELQSLVTLEAMSAGKPVVAADAMALPHLVHSGHNGWLYQPGDIGELTFRLATLIGDPDLRRRMGSASRQLVARHAMANTLDRFEQLYRQLQRASATSIRRAA